MKLIRDERGQGMLEYILIVALVVVGAITLWTTFGDEVQRMISESNTELEKVEAK